MRYASLFDGLGAAHLAAPAGWDCVASSEIDPHALAVLAHHWPSHRQVGDVTAFDWDSVHGSVDLVCGGSPCQSFSIAGKRLGLDDPRGNLALVFLDVVRRSGARWFVYENVPGLLSSDGGRDFGAFLGAVGQLGFGYCYRVLDAQHFGVPQRRRRVFVVGYLGDWRPAAAVLLEPEGMRGDSPPSREAGKGVAGAIAASTGGSDENDARDGRLIATARCLTARHGMRLDWETETFVTHTLRGDGFDALTVAGHGTPLVPMAFNWQSGGDCRGLEPSEITMALQREQVPAAHIGSAVRRLTPTEVERLQGIPDDHTLVPYRGKPMADGPRYKLVGNSWAVPVARWIFARVDTMDAILRRRVAA
jgi:DNA (cytosine-5)-methyltransferase 1